MGAFHSTKTFEHLEIAANGTEISWKSFQKFRKLLNFRNANHSTENFRNSGSKVEWKENFREIFFENLGIPREVVLFSGNVGKSSFTGRCRKFKPEVLVEWKAPLVFMRGRFLVRGKVTALLKLWRRGGNDSRSSKSHISGFCCPKRMILAPQKGKKNLLFIARKNSDAQEYRFRPFSFQILIPNRVC